MEGQRRHGSNTRERAAAESTEGHSEEAHLVPHREAEGAGPETTTSCQQAETLAEKSGGEQMIGARKSSTQITTVIKREHFLNRMDEERKRTEEKTGWLI